MLSIKPVFTRVAAPDAGISTFWLMVWAIAILDDSQRREEKRRKKKREQKAAPRRKPPTKPGLG